MACSSPRQCYSQAVSMQRSLFPSNYSAWVFPYAGATQNLSVSVGILIFKLLALTNEKVLSIAAEIDLKWIDPNINWIANPNVTSLAVNKSQVWTMSLYLMGPATSTVYLRPENLVQLSASENGTSVRSSIITSIDTICETMSLQQFPFDTQQCAMRVLYCDDSFQSLAFSNASTIMDSTSSNDEWEIIHAFTQVQTIYLQGYSPYPGFIIDFTMQRRSYYYFFNLIIPTVILHALIALVFILPTEQGGKIKLSSTLILSVYVLQNSVGQLIPNFRPGETPHFVVAQQIGFILAAVSLVESVLVQTLRIWSPHFPMSVNRFVDRLFRFRTCGKRPKAEAEFLWLNQSEGDTVLASVEPLSSFQRNMETGNAFEDLLKHFVCVEKERLKLERELYAMKRFRWVKQEVANRAWRNFEYTLNFVCLVVYVICIAYYFGYYIYS